MGALSLASFHRYFFHLAHGLSKFPGFVSFYPFCPSEIFSVYSLSEVVCCSYSA